MLIRVDPQISKYSKIVVNKLMYIRYGTYSDNKRHSKSRRLTFCIQHLNAGN